MVNTTSFITFLFLFLLGACQVKETASNGGLISGHTPTTNKFTVTPPQNKTYVEGETLRFKLSFPFDIQTDFSGGQPLLKLKIGSNVRDALFIDAPTLRELIFEYVITSNDNAPNGVEVQSLNSNGSLLQFLKEEVLVDCDTGSVKPTTHSQIKIDTERPSTTKLMLTSKPGLYHSGDELLFSLTMSERVHVTGTPTFNFTLSGKTVSASYLSGTNSQLLVFSYIVTDNDYDIDGFDSIGTSLSLVSGTIVDAVGNSITPTLPALSGTPSNAYQVIGEVPHLINVKIPSNGIYEVAKNLDFEFEFDRHVNVTGTPKYIITLGSGANKTTRDVNYVSGSGTNKLLFSYVTVPGDIDPDGIEISQLITKEASSDIKADIGGRSFFTPPANNSFVPPSSKGIILKSLLPQAISVSRNGDTTKNLKTNAIDNVWIIGQRLTITVNFNTDMVVIPAPPNVPLLEFFVGGVKKQAKYLSGGDGQTALIFYYDIQENDYDVAGDLSLGNIVLNGALITDRLNTIADLNLPAGSKLASTRIDGVRPTIKKINPPANKTYSTVVTGMNFSLEWSEEVYLSSATGLSLKIDIGGSETPFTTTLPTGALISAFNQPNLAGKNDADGVTLVSPLATTGKVFDVAGNEAQDLSFSPVNTSGIIVDTTKPTVTSVIPLTADGIYKENDEIFVQVTFNEPVEAILSGTANYLSMQIGTTNLRLTPTATKTDTTHTFKYTVKTGDNGVFKIGNAFTGSIYDLGQNTPNNISSPPTTPGIIIDAKAPTISGSTGTMAAKTLVEGDILEISLTFDENVFVTGTPSIPVNFGGGENDFIYTSGSDTPTLKFQRTITENHFNMIGLPNNITTLNLNGGKIVDQTDHPISTNFSARKIDLSKVRITYAEVKLWVQSDFTNIAKAGFSIANEGASTTETFSGTTYRIFSGDDNIRFNSAQSLSAHVLMGLKAPNIDEDIDVMGSNIQLTFNSGSNNYDVIPATGAITGGSASFNKGSRGLIQTQQTIDFSASERMFGLNFNGSIGEIIIIDDSIDPAKLNKVKTYLSPKF